MTKEQLGDLLYDMETTSPTTAYGLEIRTKIFEAIEKHWSDIPLVRLELDTEEE